MSDFLRIPHTKNYYKTCPFLAELLKIKMSSLFRNAVFIDRTGMDLPKKGQFRKGHIPAYYRVSEIVGVRSIFPTLFGKWQQRCGLSL